MANDPNDAVEKVLAALRHAAPPEGMGARIAQRLQHAAAQPAARPRTLFATSTLSGAWWHGALTGAAAATLAVCALLLLQHRSQPAPRNHDIATTPASIAPAAPTQTSSLATPVNESSTPPCAAPAVLRVRTRATTPWVVATPDTATLRAEITAPSRPAPALALTPQERELMRLARTADPKQLATINTEDHARLEAQDEADFQKLVAPPQPTDAPANNE